MNMLYPPHGLTLLDQMREKRNYQVEHGLARVDNEIYKEIVNGLTAALVVAKVQLQVADKETKHIEETLYTAKAMKRDLWN